MGEASALIGAGVANIHNAVSAGVICVEIKFSSKGNSQQNPRRPPSPVNAVTSPLDAKLYILTFLYS